MAFERIAPMQKAVSRAISGQAYVRITPKALYISAAAGRMISGEYITIDLDAKHRLIRFSSCEPETARAFKLSTVNETRDARRIETNNALLSMIDAGLPRGAMNKRLPCSLSLDGALIVDYAYYPAPIAVREEAARA